MSECAADINIINEPGQIDATGQATDVFKKYMDQEQLSRISNFCNPSMRIRIANAIILCDPSSVFIHTGPGPDKDLVKQLSTEKKQKSPLAMEGHTIHFDLAKEQGRIVNRTFYITNTEDHISSLANRMDHRFKATCSFKCTSAGNNLQLEKGIQRHTGIVTGSYGRDATTTAAHTFAGGDLAQMWIPDDGSIRLVNLECEFFGRTCNLLKSMSPNCFDRYREVGHA